MEEQGKGLWTEIALDPQHERWKLLSDTLTKEGVDNTYEPTETTLDTFEETVNQATDKYAALRIGPPFGEPITRHFVHEPALTMSLGAADTLVPIHGKWWTRSCLFMGFHHMFREYGENFNMQGTALVAGAGAAARVALAALIKVGFQHIKITNQFHDQAFDLIASLKKSYFGVRFEFVPVNQLILLPGTNSVMINTTPSVVSNELIKELMYFNFLEPGGEVWDLTTSPVETSLIVEAEQIGTKVVRGFELASWADVVWAEWAFGHRLDRQAYAKVMEEMLRKNAPSTPQSETGL